MNRDLFVIPYWIEPIQVAVTRAPALTGVPIFVGLQFPLQLLACIDPLQGVQITLADQFQFTGGAVDPRCRPGFGFCASVHVAFHWTSLSSGSPFLFIRQWPMPPVASHPPHSQSEQRLDKNAVVAAC